MECMSESDIRNLEVFELKDLITELTLKIANLEQAKKDYAKTMGDMVKTNKKSLTLCIEVLSGKDSELARRMLVEVAGLIPKSG